MKDLRLHGVVGRKKGNGLEALELSISNDKVASSVGSFENGKMLGVEYFRLPWVKDENNSQTKEYNGKSMIDFPKNGYVPNGDMLEYRRLADDKFLAVYQYMVCGIIYLECKVHQMGMQNSHIVSRNTIRLFNQRSNMDSTAQINMFYNHGSNYFGFVERVGELNIDKAYYLIGTKWNSSCQSGSYQPCSYVGVTVDKKTNEIMYSNVLNNQYHRTNNSYRRIYETIPSQGIVIDLYEKSYKGYIKAIKFDMAKNIVKASSWTPTDVSGGLYQTNCATLLGGVLGGKPGVLVAKSGYSSGYTNPRFNLFEIIEPSESTINLTKRGTNNEGTAHNNLYYMTFSTATLSSGVNLYYGTTSSSDNMYRQYFTIDWVNGVERSGNYIDLGYTPNSSSGRQILTTDIFQLPARKSFVRVDSNGLEIYYIENALRKDSYHASYVNYTHERLFNNTYYWAVMNYANNNLNLGYTGSSPTINGNDITSHYSGKYRRLISGGYLYSSNSYYYPVLRYFMASSYSQSEKPYNFIQLPIYSQGSKDYALKIADNYMKVKLNDTSTTFRQVTDGDIIDMSKLDYTLKAGATYYLDQCGNLQMKLCASSIPKWYKKLGIAMNNKELLIRRS